MKFFKRNKINSDLGEKLNINEDLNKALEESKMHLSTREDFPRRGDYAVEAIVLRQTWESDTSDYHRNEVLLVKHGKITEEDNLKCSVLKWALPGGGVDIGKESSKTAACRKLLEETGISVDEDYLRLNSVQDSVNGNSRGKIASIVYVCPLHSYLDYNINVGDEGIDYMWHNCSKELPDMPFDHKEILENYIKTLYVPPPIY